MQPPLFRRRSHASSRRRAFCADSTLPGDFSRTSNWNWVTFCRSDFKLARSSGPSDARIGESEQRIEAIRGDGDGEDEEETGGPLSAGHGRKRVCTRRGNSSM